MIELFGLKELSLFYPIYRFKPLQFRINLYFLKYKLYHIQMAVPILSEN